MRRPGQIIRAINCSSFSARFTISAFHLSHPSIPTPRNLIYRPQRRSGGTRLREDPRGSGGRGNRHNYLIHPRTEAGSQLAGRLASERRGNRHKKKRDRHRFFLDKARLYIYNLYSACYLRRPQANGKSAADSTNNIYIAEARGSVRKSHVVVFVVFLDTLPQPSAGVPQFMPKTCGSVAH